MIWSAEDCCPLDHCNCPPEFHGWSESLSLQRLALLDGYDEHIGRLDAKFHSLFEGEHNDGLGRPE